MGKYRLIALDMDGTVLDEEQKISTKNRDAIQAAMDRGLVVSFSTGRGRQSVLPYIEEMQLSSPMVLVNGSEVWMSPEELAVRHEIPGEWISELREQALLYDVWYWAYAVDGVYNRDNWSGQTKDRVWLKFGYYTEDPAARQAIWEKVREKDRFEVTNSHPCNIELNPKGVSKASGLKEVCRRLGIDMSEVVAVGDSLNDLAMIREAGLGVAMGNAQEEVKKAADWTTVTNEEDGVAEVIFKKVLGE